jgi:hypothetical protein
MLIPTQEELNVYQTMAKTAGQSQLFANIGGEARLLSIMLMARELGLPPMQALMGGMNVIQGKETKVELSPRLMNSMIRKAGHKIEILESTEQLCKLKGNRHDTKEEYVCVFTIDDARRAGLVRGGGGWEKFASDMLFARCLSRLARRLFADVISTAYVEGEIDRVDTYEKVEAYLPPEVAEVIPEKPTEMTIEQFKEKLRETVGMNYELIDLLEYLDRLATESGISVAKIMGQAIQSSRVERFCKSWKRWWEKKQASIEEVSKL